MYEDDRKILTNSRSLLNDAIINGAQKLLSHAPGFTGFQNTQLGKGIKFKAIEKSMKFVQILHVNSNHWITISNLYSPPDCVYIYDSLHNFVTLQTKKQICSIIRSEKEHLKFCIMNVETQKDMVSCGLFAVAFATELCNRGDLVTASFDSKQLRSHLLSCLSNKMMTTFPKIGNIKPTEPIKRIIKERLICVCHMPAVDTKIPILQCKICSSFYHTTCCKFHCQDT